jgi:hypothetical protein
MRWMLAGLLLVVAVNAFGGGWYGMAGAPGVPIEWLDGSPFDSYLVPSVILFAVVGGTFLIAAIGVLARARWSWFAVAAAVVVATVWLTTQLAIIGAVSWLQPATAAAIVAVALLAWRQRATLRA